MVELATDRLLLRQWRESDAQPWAEMNADPQVMEHFPATLTRAEADAFRSRHGSVIDQRGWGLWAVEVVDSETFIGFVGLAEATFEAEFTPALEIGWRLARRAWGNGYATEAAERVLAFAFDELDRDEIVSFTATTNEPSVAVMRRIGLQPHRLSPFDHPNLEPGHRLQRHVLYAVTAEQWRDSLLSSHPSV